MKSITFFQNYLSKNFNELQLKISILILKIFIILKLMTKDLYS
jgi:hypothetical protein